MRSSCLKSFCSRRYFSQTTTLFSSQKQTSPSQQWLPPTVQSNQKKVTFETNLPSHTNNTADDHFHYMKNFSSLIKDLFKNPRNFVALKNLDSMLKNTHFLDSASSVYVVEGLCKIKKLQRAKNVILDLRKNLNVSDYFLYSLVIDCLVRDGKIHDVEVFWNEICGSDSRKIDVSDYVIYLCKFGDVWEIERVWERVLMGGNWVLREQSYAALIGAFCSKDEGLLAKEVLREMNGKGFEADDITYVVMFQCFCRNGELEEADMILRRLVRREYKMDICIYGSFMYGLCKSGKIREADKLYRKLIKNNCLKGSDFESLKQGRRAIFQLNCEGAVPEVMVYETYFRSLCSVGRLDEAEMVLKKMMKKRTMPEICVYGSFIKALFRAGREEDAMRFVNAERRKGLVCVSEMSRFIISGLCETGKVDDALRIFNDIVTRGGFASIMGVYNCILDSYWREGRVAEAESLFERVRDGTFGPPDTLSYANMANGFCKRGDISKALYIFEEMLTNNIPVNTTLYGIIIKGLCDCGRLKEAHTYLNYMIEKGHLVSYNRWRALFCLMLSGDRHGSHLSIEAQ